MIPYALAQLLHTAPKHGKDSTFRVAPAIDILKKHLPTGHRIIDIGCRNDVEPSLLRAAGWQVEAVDLWPMAPGIRRAAMERLPYPNCSFDAAFLSHSFEHARDLRQAAAEIIRVVRPRGLVWIEVPFMAEPNAHDRHRFDRPSHILDPFTRSGGCPVLVETVRRGEALGVLFRLDRPLRVTVALLGDLHVRNWSTSGLLDAMAHRWGEVSTIWEDAPVTGAPWRRWLRARLRAASFVTLSRRWPIYRHKLALREARARRYRWENVAWRGVEAVMGAERLARLIERLLPADRSVGRYLWGFRPDVLVVPTTISEGLEVELAKAARRLRIPVVAHAATWDCLVGKGSLLGYRLDRLLVWGEQGKTLAVGRHGFRPEQVVVTGPPQYDLYYQPDRSHDALPFPFVYVPGSTLSWWPDMVALLKGLAAILPPEIRLCFTPHPNEKAFLEELKWLEGRLWMPPMPPGWKWNRDTFSFVGKLLRHAKCIVSPWSTLIVEAALFGTPSVLVGFGRGVAIHEDWEHIAPLKSWPGIWVARSMEDLEAHVRRLVEAPPRAWPDLQARAQELARADGHAGERIMQAIEEVALRKDAVQ